MSQRIRSSRRTRLGWRWAAGVIPVALLVAGCGGSSGGSTGTTSGGGKQVVVGLITKTDTNPFFVKMKEGAQKAAKADGAKLLTAAGKFDGDNAGQVTALENMVAAGAKGILITPSDTKAIVPSIAKARAKGVLVIALDTPTDPQSAVDALFATNNFKAGVLIGQYTKAVEAGKTLKIATLDLAPGISVGILRHNGFISGLGAGTADEKTTGLVNPASVVCSNDTQGDQAKGQTAMENCLKKAPDINVVYTINEPAANGANKALTSAGKTGVTIVSVDGGCAGVGLVKSGVIGATSQQYPLKMASLGVQAIYDLATSGKKPAVSEGLDFYNTGVALVTDKAATGVTSISSADAEKICWG